jgi:hypothetical protein
MKKMALLRSFSSSPCVKKHSGLPVPTTHSPSSFFESRGW